MENIKEQVIQAQREIIQGYYNRIVMRQPSIEEILQWLEGDLQTIRMGNIVLDAENLINLPSQSQPMENIKVEFKDHDKVVLTKPNGDTYTSKSPEFIDFLHGANSVITQSQPKEVGQPTIERLYVVEYAGFFIIQKVNYYAEGQDVLDADHVGYNEAKATAHELVRLYNESKVHPVGGELPTQDWISVNDALPTDFDEQGQTQNYLVHIDNPFFKNGNYHVSYFEKSAFGDQYNHWCGIETNVHHGTTRPNVTHWKPLPPPPTSIKE